MSTRRHTPGVYSQPRPKGPGGERLCYNCRGPMPADKRKFNCSAACSEAWRCKTSPAHMRYVIECRDKGVCALCGIDTLALKREYEELRNRLKKSSYDSHTPELRDWREAHGIPTSRVISDWWDADHITPVVEGGGECGPEGYRTLCIPCHQEETAKLAARRATDRKRQKFIERDEARGLLEGL